MRAAAQLQRKLTGRRCRCAACGEHFNAVSIFDRHRVGAAASRRCLSVSEMLQRCWSVNAAGFWMGAQRPAWPITARILDAIDELECECRATLTQPTARAERHGPLVQVEAPTP